MKKVVIISVVFFLLVGAAGAVLYRVQSGQKLGKPGLKMVDQVVLNEKGGVVNTNTVALPEEVPGYESSTLPVTMVELGWLPPDTTYGRRKYRGLDKFEITTSIVLMGGDRGSIHKPQICLTGQGWTITETKTMKVPMAQPVPYDLPVMRLVARKKWAPPGQQPVEYSAVFLYWFVADGQLTPHHGERMWWMARDLLTKGTLQRWAYVSYLAVCMPGQEEKAYDRLSRFIARTVPEYQLVPSPAGENTLAKVVEPR